MRTKIIATIGPASNNKATLTNLVQSGVSIFRLNFSHGSASDFKDIINLIRELEKELQTSLCIMQDLAGPKMRIGQIAKSPLSIIRKQKILIGIKTPRSKGNIEGQLLEAMNCGEEAQELPFLPFDDENILSSLEAGDKVALSDGALQLVITAKLDSFLFEAVAQNSGLVTSRKGIVLPGKTLDVSALTSKDIENLKDGLALGVDAVAISYVQRDDDVLLAKKIIAEAGYDVPVVAKLERQNAVKNLDKIIAAADVIMVARGDLGLECPMEELPTLQKRIIKACNKASKPAIVATQMLLSMVNSTFPTRAEITDVANAVLDGSDCVMLSEETAMGSYPVECVNVMQKIINNAEELLLEENILPEPEASKGAPDFLAYAACLLAEKSKACALVAHSTSGLTARLLSVRQPRHPIYVLTPAKNVLHSLNFCWGVIPVLNKSPNTTHLETLENFIDLNTAFTQNDTFVIVAGQPNRGSKRSKTNLVKIYTK